MQDGLALGRLPTWSIKESRSFGYLHLLMDPSTPPCMVIDSFLSWSLFPHSWGMLSEQSVHENILGYNFVCINWMGSNKRNIYIKGVQKRCWMQQLIKDSGFLPLSVLLFVQHVGFVLTGFLLNSILDAGSFNEVPLFSFQHKASRRGGSKCLTNSSSPMSFRTDFTKNLEFMGPER